MAPSTVPITTRERTEILRAVAAGEPVLDILKRLSVPIARLYRLRRHDASFEQQFLAAARAAGGSRIKPIRSAPTRRRDFDRQRVLELLRSGKTVPQAAKAVGVLPQQIYFTRQDEPEFDQAVRRDLRTATPMRDFDRRSYLAAVRDGATLRDAARSVGVSEALVIRRRRQEPHFDRAVLNAYRGDLITKGVPQLISSMWICAVVGCEADKPHAKGLCSKHYHQRYRTGEARPAGWRYGRTTCEASGCSEPHRAKGLCIKHYTQRRRS